jgi:galactose mutarotase-like enzyme
MGSQDSPVRVDEANYKGEHAIAMESAALRVVIVPGWGAKTASLIHKKTNREYLDQLPGLQFRKGAYGAPYDSGEASGFDDMFPTISECYCEVEPWAGARMPDHGEVWSLPWKCEVSGAEVCLSVHGVRFPYVLSKRISFDGENTILMSYRAQNLSAYEFPAMWAAHPLFTVTPGTRIILPEMARNIINTVPGPALGGYGGRFNFPAARTAEGREWDLCRSQGW